VTAPARRQDAGAAVAGLFDRPSVTGGLAGAQPPPEQSAADTSTSAQGDAARDRARSSGARSSSRRRGEARLRLGVELGEREIEFLRSLSRPARTGGARSLGAKFVATGVLAAAIELLQATEVDMRDVGPGQLEQMMDRARAALIAAGRDDTTERSRA
jgi:hypothetical protein